MSKGSPAPESLAARWESICQRQGAALAVYEQATATSWSFEQLDEVIRERMRELEPLGLRRHGVVLYRPNTAAWLCDFMALRGLGTVVIPVDASYTSERAREIGTRFKAAAILSEAGMEPCAPQPRRWKADCALVKLTSGTSGTPKGLVFDDAEMLADADAILATMGITHRDRNLCLHPLGHSYALGSIVYPLLAHGIPVVLGESPFPHAIADALCAGEATVLPTVPAILEGLCKSRPPSLGPLRLVISASAALKPALAKAFLETFGLRVHNFYGASETGGITYDSSGEAALQGAGVGRPLKGVNVSLGPQGRLQVTSWAACRYGRKVSTGMPATWQLADRAQISPDGDIQLLGRADRIAKVAGKRIDLGAVERAIAEHFPDARIALFARQDSLWLLTEVEVPGLADALQKHCPVRCQLRVSEAIPVNARGKVDYARASQLLGKGD